MAVVGAGPSGLATVKELLDEGHDPTCFERASGLGGVFRFDEDAGVVWESCRLTSSGLMTAFSDFPVSPEHAGHMSVGEYVAYLERYCAAFGVDRCLRFGTAVDSIAPDGNGGWRVGTVGPEDVRREERFDAVAVCSGLHQNPHVPQFPGQETFRGEILHAARYRRPGQVGGKRVLIVGAGESGADVVAEVSEHAAETVVSLRRGVAVLPRTIRGHPNDYRTCRINNASAPWVFETRHPEDAGKRNLYRTVFLPIVVADKLVQLSLVVADRLRPWSRVLHRGGVATARAAGRRRRVTQQLLRESGGTRQEQFGTKSDDWVAAIVSGRCRRAAQIARFEGDQAVFEDGAGFTPDLVILCTGFETRTQFLDPELATAPRYLHTFVPAVGASLGFIGFVRPSFGAIPPMAELQARWFARLLSGKAALPREPEMHEAIDRLARFRRRHFRAVRQRLDYLVDYTSFSDELASQIGCKPTRDALRRESALFRRRFMVGPFVAAQYRLVGPHAEPGVAREVISNLPVAYPRRELATFRLRWRLSRVLHRMLGPRFAPKLVVR